MNDIRGVLEGLESLLASSCEAAHAGGEIAELSDEGLTALLALAGRIQRRVESVVVEAVGQVVERSGPLRQERLCSAYGCARPVDLVRMLMLVDRRTASRLVKASGLVRRPWGLTAGAFLPAEYESLRGAMDSGVLGADGLLAAVAPLESARRRLRDEDLLAADARLASFARGIDTIADTEGAVGAGPLPTPEDLGALSSAIVAYLDPDGAEPDDESASRGRGLMIGVARGGLVPVRGEMLPDVAGQLRVLMDTILNPRAERPEAPAGVVFQPENGGIDGAGLEAEDQRTRVQKQHDAFAMILGAAAQHAQMPSLGGAAPTLVVSVRAEDYLSGHGQAVVANTGDRVPLRVAAQTACAGGVQRVLFDERGRIVSIGTSGRVFNALQRRAIVARDETCVVPGCGVPATWCEIHHVIAHAEAGPTHTDNGVPLCWHHHRTLHLEQWQLRMRHGVPEIRGPSWWDPERRWRPAGATARARADARSRGAPVGVAP